MRFSKYLSLALAALIAICATPISANAYNMDTYARWESPGNNSYAQPTMTFSASALGKLSARIYKWCLTINDQTLDSNQMLEAVSNTSNTNILKNSDVESENGCWIKPYSSITSGTFQLDTSDWNLGLNTLVLTAYDVYEESGSASLAIQKAPTTRLVDFNNTSFSLINEKFEVAGEILNPPGVVSPGFVKMRTLQKNSNWTKWYKLPVNSNKFQMPVRPKSNFNVEVQIASDLGAVKTFRTTYLVQGSLRVSAPFYSKAFSTITFKLKLNPAWTMNVTCRQVVHRSGIWLNSTHKVMLKNGSGSFKTHVSSALISQVDLICTAPSSYFYDTGGATYVTIYR